MRRQIFSQSWHNVASLRPRLLPQARMFRHRYRGQYWYIIQDPSGNRHHRMTPAAYSLVRRMNGELTVQQLWDEACEIGGDNLPTQNEIVELLMQLHANDLLATDVSPDAAELFERYRKRRNQKWKQSLMNPMGVRVPLIDPDKFLNRWIKYLAWAFDKRGLFIWLAIVLPAVVLAGQHWNELTLNLSDRVLAAHNLPLLMISYAVIKALHELGHGFATKVWGGNVHEMGLMFLVFAPVPYVDASASSSFHSKKQRAIVAAAGILVEVLLAAIAMYVWLLVEPGLVRAIAFDVMFMAGVSTVLVNGNPLLRFDGYYLLTDLIEIPNLAQRGQNYLKYLSDYYLFGARELEAPDETRSEKRWLIFYTIASWFYRIFLMISIILFVAGEFFIFGVLLAIWSAITLFVFPVWKSIKHILHSQSLQRHRPRAIKVSTGLVTGFLLFISLVPLPLRTTAEGVVWLPDDALVRTGADGFFQQWLVEPGTYVEAGTPLFVLHNSQLATDFAATQARLVEASSRYRIKQFSNPAEAAVLQQQLRHAQQTLKRIERRKQELVVYSKTAGILSVLKAEDMQGQYFKQGQLLAYILDPKRFIARIAVEQPDIELVQSHLKAVQVRLADDMSNVYSSTVIRQVPSAIDELPSAALTPEGGGIIATDPSETGKLKPLQRVFLFDLALPEKAFMHAFGGRVHIRFSHNYQPLLYQWYRRVRQLFLSHFHV